jgi:TolB-like protein/class 3 adenylate cyclase/cytochrome c-type biogenesis protein CcmH/NrfG
LSAERVERRLAAILAADVAGYSRLMGLDEAGTLARLNALRRELIDPKVAEHKGRIVKTTGDGILIEFPSVVEAVACALAVQGGMALHNAAIPQDRRIEFRIGINTGDVIVEDGDIHGDGVNVAARLEALAEPGGVCVSAIVQGQVEGRLDCAFDDIGEQSLKNIARPVRVYRVRADRAATPAAGPALALPDKPSIAVLPFENMSGDPEQEYFADGMVEDITTALSKIRWFFVIARNSAFAYKGRAVDVKQVGRELGVRYVLEGSVRKGGNRLRITVQLVDAATGNHVWAERYDRQIADIFAVQDEITERVAAAIEPELYAAEHVRSQRKLPDNLDAWECVIRALSCIGQGTPAENAEAEALCRRAIGIAPGYAQAHSLLAWALLRRTSWSGGFRMVVPEASAEARAALGLDDRDPWAHLAQGMLSQRLSRFDEAERALRRALELNPNFALAHAIIGLPLAQQGMHDEAVSSAEHALRLSPNDRLVGTYAFFAMAVAHFSAGNYVECTAWARKMLEKNPEDTRRYYFLAGALAMQGDLNAATEARDTLLRLRPGFSLAWMTENMPNAGAITERLREGLRQAGVPEK